MALFVLHRHCLALLVSTLALMGRSQPLEKPPGFEELIHTVLLNQLALSDMMQNKNNCTGILEVPPTAEPEGIIINSDILKEVRESLNTLKDEIKRDVNEFLHKLKEEVKGEVTEEKCSESHSRSLHGEFVESNSLLIVTSLAKNSTEHGQGCPENMPVDCLGYRRKGHSTSGVYHIYPSSCCKPVRVFCDMDTDGGGWTVFFARETQVIQEEFARGWDDYKNGFGNPWTEYWLGNEHLHQLTGEVPFIFRMDAEDNKGIRKHGQWFVFSIGDADSRYQLKIGDFRPQLSTMGDSMGQQNGMAFSTLDQDNDKSGPYHCGKQYGAWWQNACSYALLTRPLIDATGAPTNLVTWTHWNPPSFSGGAVPLRWLQLKIRPKDFIGPARVCR